MREAESGRSGSFWTLVMVIFFSLLLFFNFFALMQNTRTRLCVFLACSTHTEQTQAQRATRFNSGRVESKNTHALDFHTW